MQRSLSSSLFMKLRQKTTMNVPHPCFLFIFLALQKTTIHHLLVIFIELHKKMTSFLIHCRFLQLKKKQKKHRKPKEDNEPPSSSSFSATQEKKP